MLMNTILNRIRMRAENGVYTGYAKTDVVALLAHVGLLTCAVREAIRAGETDNLKNALEHVDAPATN
jgi:hypothetical protein